MQILYADNVLLYADNVLFFKLLDLCAKMSNGLCKNEATRPNSKQNSRNKILISIDTSSTYYVDFKYIRIFRLSLVHKRLRI